MLILSEHQNSISKSFMFYSCGGGAYFSLHQFSVAGLRPTLSVIQWE